MPLCSYTFCGVEVRSYLADTCVDPNFPACLFLSTSPRTSDIHGQGFIIDVPCYILNWSQTNTFDEKCLLKN